MIFLRKHIGIKEGKLRMVDFVQTIKRRDGTSACSQGFEYLRSHRGWYARIESGAVVLPLIGKRRPRRARDCFNAVAALRRKHLQARALAGHLSLEEAGRLVRCRPAFAHVRPALGFCKYELCPYCWARKAAWAWQAVDAALFAVPPGQKQKRPRFEYDLVLASRTFKPEVLKPYVKNVLPNLSLVFADRLACRKKDVKGPVPARGPEMDGLDFLGALDRLAIAPEWKDPKTWQISIRQVFVVPPGGTIAIQESKQRRFEKPKRKQVAAAIAWLHRYPRGFLIANGKTARPEATSLYLAARKDRRLSAAYGIFRKTTAQRSPVQDAE